MLTIIQQWLRDSLGIVIDLNKDEFTKNLQDGFFIAQILHGFDIISEEQIKCVERTEKEERAYTNYQDHIKHWLKLLDVTLEDYEINDIVKGKDNAAINLFYELYLALQDKNKLYFIVNQRKKEKLKLEHSLFNVKKVKESTLNEFEVEVNNLCVPLIENSDVIRWHKKRLLELKKECEEARQDYLKYTSTKKKEPPSPIQCQCKTDCPCPFHSFKQSEIDYPTEPSQNFTYEELIRQQNSKSKCSFQIDPNSIKTTINKLKNKRLETKKNNIFKQQVQTELCAYLWDQAKKEQESHIDEIVSEKLTSLSFYEKQMINKMFQVKHQQEVMKENREFIQEEIFKETEIEVAHSLSQEESKSNECVCDYYYEKERILELHRRLYSSKLKIKKQKIVNICKETAEDLINLAIRISEFTHRYQMKPSERKLDEWKTLFVQCKPILPRVRPTEDILQDLSDLPEQDEKTYIEEIERQDAMDDRDYEKYHNIELPWSNFKINISKLGRRTQELGMNVLGYIVNRLLNNKYQNVCNDPKSEFNFKYAVCINGLTDMSILSTLRCMLNLKGIEIIEISTVINFCMKMYQQEHSLPIPDDIQSVDEVIQQDSWQQRSKKSVTKGKNKKGLKDIERSKSNLSMMSYIPPEVKTKNKKHQTPPIFPCEEIKLSSAAQLGQIAFTSLEHGEALTDYLICAMIVEYLRSISNKEGWLLINYPTTYSQAIILEENLSSTSLHKNLGEIKSIVDLTELDEQEKNINNTKNNDKHKSKLFLNPVKQECDDFYETPLTAYIKLIKASDPEKAEPENNFPPVLRFIDDNTDKLDKFYAEQGCNYFMFYDNFDSQSIKYLARLVIGDFTLPRKPSVELFGSAGMLCLEEIDEMSSSAKLPRAAFESSSEQRPKKKLFMKLREASFSKIKTSKDSTLENVDEIVTNSNTNNVKDKKKKKNALKSSSTIKPQVEIKEKEVQVPPLEEVFDIIYIKEDLNAKPGEENWYYIDWPIQEETLVLLATLAENLEDIYIQDFKQVLFMRRLICNAIQPYITNTRNHLMMLMKRPDNRQEILHEFQLTFNQIPNLHRSDEEVKAELHCRVDDLRKKFTDHADNNMNDSLAERDRLIEENWIRKQVYELSQVYLCAFQLEIERSVNTLELVTDYYYAAITGLLWDEQQFLRDNLKCDPDMYGSLSYEKIIDWKNAYDISHINDKMSLKEKKSLDMIEKNKLIAFKIMTATREGKISLMAKQLTRKSSGTNMSDIIRDNLDKIVDEWKMAIDGECERASFRIKLIKAESYERFRQVINSVRDMMQDVYNKIRSRYNNELSSIDQVCEVFCKAIENETSISNELILDDETFYVRPDIILYQDEISSPLPQPKEWNVGELFTSEQLLRFLKHMKQIAPCGYIPERTFAFILQDMITVEAEDGLEPPVPSFWKTIQPYQLDKILDEMFLKTECVYWKDFIIYNLMLRMPTDTELLSLRKYFKQFDLDSTENVNTDIFLKAPLWFEVEVKDLKCNESRIETIKTVICEMYKINKDCFNYSAMLMDFCKDCFSYIGFAKALSIVLGNNVCWDNLTGKNYIANRLKWRRAHEEEVEQRGDVIKNMNKMVQGFVGEMIDTTVHKCDSATITEVETNSSLNSKECSDSCICDIECFCERNKKESPKVSVGSENNPDPPLEYFLDLEAVVTVQSVILTWQNKVENFNSKSFRESLEDIYEECKNSLFNNAVFSHEFLNHPKFSKLLSTTNRFSDKNSVQIIRAVVNDK